MSKEILNKGQTIKNLNEEILNNKNNEENKNVEIEKLLVQLKLKKEEIDKLNNKIKQNIFLLKDLDKAQKEIHNLEQELNLLNKKLEEKEEQINQYKSNITQEQNKNNSIYKQKEKLEAEIDSLKTEIVELTKGKAIKLPKYISLEKESLDKFIIKNTYSQIDKENKEPNKTNALGIIKKNESSTKFNQREEKEIKFDEEKENINSNQININEKENELTPENYDLVKIIKLKNNLKWFLFKKLKIKPNLENNNINLKKEQKTKTLSRRFRCFSHRKEEKESEENNQSNDSYSNYLFKPQKNRKEFLDFCQNNREASEDKQKKIDYLEKNLKEMEEKLDKKEKDFNRLNLNYAKMINKSKRQDNNSNEELIEKLEKVRDENKKLKNTITKYKSEQQFIGLSFIADDLEGEQFIDDKCFEEILDGLVDEDKDKKEFKDNNADEKEKDKDKKTYANYGNNNFYFESKINYDKSSINTINTINTNNTINNPSGRHFGARGYYKSKRKNA